MAGGAVVLGRRTGSQRRYELLDQIGAGSHGTVWAAWDRDHQRGVVVKLAPERSSPEIEHRFLQERRLRVDHPNVIGAIDDLDHRGRLGFVMELADAGDLHAVVERNGPLDPEQVALLARELLAGLDHLHRRGILHRDIKPTNVLFRTVHGDVTAAIGDLGTALDLDGPRLTTFSERIGTVGFMAPEVERGEEASERSDLYSLGRTLEFALTGSARTAPRPEDVPDSLGHVLALLVAPDPALRARSAREALGLLPVPDPATRLPGADTATAGGRARPPGATVDDASPPPALVTGVGRLARRFAPLVAVAIVSSAVTFALVRGGSDGADGGTTRGTDGAVSAPGPVDGTLALGSRFSCVLRPGGTTRCLGSPGGSTDSAPLAASIWAGPTADGPCLVSDQAELVGCLTAEQAPGPPGGERTVAVSVDARGACAVRSGSAAGRLRCWGDASPVADWLADRDVTAVALAGTRGCALVDPGGLWCWEGSSPPAPQLRSAGSATDVAVGTHGACAVVSGRVWCWGDGSSALWPVEPRSVGGVEDPAERVVVGSDHGCSLAGGRVACWGTSGASDPPAPPVPPSLEAESVPGFDSAAIDLAAGERHTCTRTAGDEVWCWGANEAGQVDAANPSPWAGPTRFDVA